MNVTVEKLPNCLATLKIEVEPGKVSAARDSIASEYAKLAKLPGYRQGKAPRAVVERKFKKEIREELERKLLGDSTREAIAEAKAARAPGGEYRGRGICGRQVAEVHRDARDAAGFRAAGLQGPARDRCLPPR